VLATTFFRERVESCVQNEEGRCSKLLSSGQPSNKRDSAMAVARCQVMLQALGGMPNHAASLSFDLAVVPTTTLAPDFKTGMICLLGHK